MHMCIIFFYHLNSIDQSLNWNDSLHIDSNLKVAAILHNVSNINIIRLHTNSRLPVNTTQETLVHQPRF